MKVNLAADLLLVHAQAYFDFRNNGEVYWPFLSSGGSEPITPLFSAMDHFDRRNKRLAEFAEGVIVSARKV